MPASPPLMPTMTLPSTASGAAVIAWPVGLSPTCTAQRSVPDLRVERDEIAVERADVDRVVEDGDAAVDAREPEVEHAGGDRAHPFPQRLAALQIQRGHVGRARRDVHHAVGDDRRRFHRSRCPAADRPRPAAAARRSKASICVSGENRCELNEPGVHQPLAVLSRAMSRRRRRTPTVVAQPFRRCPGSHRAPLSVARYATRSSSSAGGQSRAYDGISVASSSRSSARQRPTSRSVCTVPRASRMWIQNTSSFTRMPRIYVAGSPVRRA